MRHPPTRSSLSGLGVHIALRGPTPTTDRIEAALLDRTALTPTPDRPVITYEVRDADELVILRHDETEVAHVGSAGDTIEAADIIADDIHQQIAHRSGSFLLVHAGAVAWRGVAIAIPGRSHSGKSTLTAALVRAGAEYLSDEFAVLDRAGLVHPYPRKLSIRAGAEQGTPIAAADLGGLTVDGPRPLGLVVSTRFEAGARWEPSEVTGSRALLPLIDNSVVAQTRSEHTLSTIAGLGDRITTLVGLRGEAEGTTGEILAHAERATGRPMSPEPPR